MWSRDQKGSRLTIRSLYVYTAYCLRCQDQDILLTSAIWVMLTLAGLSVLYSVQAGYMVEQGRSYCESSFCEDCIAASCYLCQLGGTHRERADRPVIIMLYNRRYSFWRRANLPHDCAHAQQPPLCTSLNASHAQSRSFPKPSKPRSFRDPFIRLTARRQGHTRRSLFTPPIDPLELTFRSSMSPKDPKTGCAQSCSSSPSSRHSCSCRTASSPSRGTCRHGIRRQKGSSGAGGKCGCWSGCLGLCGWRVWRLVRPTWRFSM